MIALLLNEMVLSGTLPETRGLRSQEHSLYHGLQTLSLCRVCSALVHCDSKHMLVIMQNRVRGKTQVLEATREISTLYVHYICSCCTTNAACCRILSSKYAPRYPLLFHCFPVEFPHVGSRLASTLCALSIPSCHPSHSPEYSLPIRSQRAHYLASYLSCNGAALDGARGLSKGCELS